MEIERFWVIRKFSWATFLFFANRYLAVIGYLPVIMEVYWTAPQRELVRFTTLSLSFNVLISIRLDVRDAVGLDGFYRLRLTITDRCHYARTYRQCLIVLIQICVAGEAIRYGLLSHKLKLCAVLLIMRVYALYDRKRWVLYLFLAIAGADIPTAVVSVLLCIRGRKLTRLFQWSIVVKTKTILTPLTFQVIPGCNSPVSYALWVILVRK